MAAFCYHIWKEFNLITQNFANLSQLSMTSVTALKRVGFRRRGFMDKIYLVLENGVAIEGKSIGVKGEAIGEVVFNTQMLGYLGTLTDSRYFGQIVVETFPLIGNYGVVESSLNGDKAYLSGFVVRNICDLPSNFMSIGNLNDFLIEKNVVGICDIDTRHLTKVIRENGTMNGIITANPKLTDSQKKALKEFKIKKALENTCNKCDIGAFSKTSKRVILWDFGYTCDIKKQLEGRGCEVIVADYTATAQDILATKPDAVVLSSGGGDPQENQQLINQIALVAESKVAMLGIGLGHQLLALAKGGKAYKSKHGHRGCNQPVKCTASGKLFVTSQNHGYVVDPDAFGKVKVNVDYINVNDGSCEGLSYLSTKQFSTQFCPEQADSPLDTSFLYDKLIKLMEE